MFRFSASLRLSIGLAFLGISVFLASRTIGLGQDEWAVATNGRAALAEAVAVHASSQVSLGRMTDLKRQLSVIVDRNNDLLSIGLRHNGKTVVDCGDHDSNWVATSSVGDNQLFVPISLHDEPWGEVQLCFTPLQAQGFLNLILGRNFMQLAFVLSAATLLYTFYLRHMLHHLDPSKVIPDRVRAALDTFAEGLLVIDRNHRVVLANRSFAETVGEPSGELQGRSVDDFPWLGDAKLPWRDALSDGNAHTGRMVDLKITDHQKLTYMVNASPIFSDKGELQGVLASFDDVTLHEQRKQELERTLRVLGESREQIRKQNAELRILATRDPLTGCMNRRAFFEEVVKVWEHSSVAGREVACIMVDVDHFKSVNDNFGHSAGDEVLRCVGKTLVDLEEVNALPCRYGGEEFCVLVEGYSEEQAREFAEGIRTILEASRPADIPITASLGVAVTENFNDSFEEVLERADQCLYVAKRRGRNRVICWNDFDGDELEESQADSSRATAGVNESPRIGIPFHAVTALISALSYRDAATAEHSRRVADLCVRVGCKLLSVRDQYVLETAALLHDIGKIGTPDSVLLKPGPLDADESEVMSHHDVIGSEIVRTTFDNEDLVSIVSNHYAWYGGHPMIPSMPTGDAIPLGARILTICDTFDAIVSDRVYRKGSSAEDAFAELRRCAGQQFDPQLVELFIDSVIDSGEVGKFEVKGNVTKRSALQIGLLMEELTTALESGDARAVKEQAKLLSEAATESKLKQIAEIADELSELAVDDAETSELLEVASTLLDLCRMTQRAYMGVGEESRRRREELARRPFVKKNEA